MITPRFIVAIGDPVLSALIRAWVTERLWLRLVQSCTTPAALTRSARINPEAVLVTDTQLAGESIVPLMAELHKAHPGLRMVVILQDPEGPMAAQVIRAGAMGIVAEGDMDGFQQAVVKVLRSELAIRGDLALRLMRAGYKQTLPAKECGSNASNRLSSTNKGVRLPAVTLR